MDDSSQDSENLAVDNRKNTTSVTLPATGTETENGNAVKSEMDTEIDEANGGNDNAVRSPGNSYGTRASRSSDKKSNKRPIVYVLDCSGDEEEFAGFDMCSGIIIISLSLIYFTCYTKKIFHFSDKNKRIKIKEEPVSDIDSTDDRQPVKIEYDVKVELETEVIIDFNCCFEELL